MLSFLYLNIATKIGVLLGIACFCLALKPAPRKVPGRTPYLNTSICLATVPATAVIDQQGMISVIDWTSPMPITLPATAACFSIGASIPALANSLPTSPAEGPTEGDPGGEGGVYFCEMAGWGQPCTYYAFEPSSFGGCWSLGDIGTSFSAVGPDQGTVIDLFTDSGCINLGLSDVIYPGFDDLQVVGLDKKVQSIFVKNRSQMGQDFASDAGVDGDGDAVNKILANE